MIHYPIAPHKQKAYKHWNNLNLPVTEKIHAEVLSLPCAVNSQKEEQLAIVKALNAFVYNVR
jgi:dTDP-4-amino-4,6-dideoxygalactose transaminase